jgi:hypothetical protein
MHQFRHYVTIFLIFLRAALEPYLFQSRKITLLGTIAVSGGMAAQPSPIRHRPAVDLMSFHLICTFCCDDL